MFNPADKQQVSAEMLDLMQKIDDQKKKRSSAVARLKACAEEVTKDAPDDTKIFRLPRSKSGPVSDDAPAVPAASPSQAPTCMTTQREWAKKARSERKSRLEALKRTTVEAVNGLRKTRYLDPEKLREQLEEASVDSNGSHPAHESNGNGTHP